MTAVLIAGIAVIDFVLTLDEMPRRAEKYRAREAAIVGGGCAANAAVAVARLGGQALLAARLGDDPIGDLILKDIDAEGVDCRLVRREKGRRSSFSSILLDRDGERQIVNYRDETMEKGAGWLTGSSVPEFDAALADTRWPDGAEAVMRLARERGKPGVMDVEAPTRIAGDALRLATHLAFSEQGLAEFSGGADLAAGLKRARAETGAFVCVTRGGDGVSWLEGDMVRTMPAFRIPVADTLGAGDVWHGAFALALGNGEDEVAAMRFANAAAAIKCSRFGGRSGAPSRIEVQEFLKERA
ncbi:sugar kinase [Stappia sp. F7233]|uniref:Sugar kinase n=1 Tax=Stappia albiluteola TaxID=2758565 RepID=A0A839A8S4_9HYPH|nr:PfkB family carbohydrate kinase [Stappia albiluteola]MBA5775923.1 sugar kinase [Stappia albiluteola]